MEGLSTNGFTRYWKRRGYKRLNGPPICLSPSLGRRQRRWRIKISPKIRRLGSPKKWLTRLRDAYVKMMLRFANAGFGANSLDSGFGRGPIKEYDQKMIVQIYKSVVRAQPHMLPCDAPNHASHLVCY